jgi:hypothetical protein
MISFTDLLTANDADLVKIFYKVKSDPLVDFIKNINSIATQLELNHSQLVCAIGFNKNIRDLTDIMTVLGFKSYKVMIYRRNELFTTDTYQQLGIDNILDIYSARLEDEEILETLRELLHPRLQHIEADIEKTDDPGYTVSYRMEIHSIYQSGIADKSFAEERIQKDIGKYRHMESELSEMINAEIFPPSNFFFMENITPDEKRELIQQEHVSSDMVKNRLQNSKISADERDMLEEFV